MKSSRLGAALCVIAVVLSACKGDNTQRPSASNANTEADSSTVFSGSNLRADLPMVGRAWPQSLPFYLSDSTNERLYTLTQKATALCMKARGFEYLPIRYPENSTAVDRVNPLDRAYAQARGYHDLLTTPIDRNVRHDDATDAALMGTETKPGCAREAYSKSYGAFEEFILQSDHALSSFSEFITGFESNQPGKSTGAGKSTAAKWSSCMNEHGYQFATPLDPRLQYADKPEITTQEIKVRMADLDCDIDSHYTQTRHDWESDRVDKWLSDNEGLVAELTVQRTNVEARLAQLEADVSQ